MTKPRRLLTVGHSYVVALNRRLAHEMAKVGAGRWDVTVAAPRHMVGDLRPIELERFADEACRLEAVDVYFSKRIHTMTYGLSMRKLLREPWDMVHCWEEPFVLSGAQIGYWAGRAPIVYYTFQNIDKNYPFPFSAIEGWCGRRCAGWLAAARTVEEVVAKRPGGFGEKPHRMIPLGVDLDVFRPDADAKQAVLRKLNWSPDGPPVIGMLGRFVPEKGIAMLQRSLAGLRSPWRAMFVGGGVMEPELRAWAATQEDRVRIVTGVKHDEVPAYLNGMDILAAPSETTPRWREQLGRMLLEAFACGVAVVGSDSGEIPFVVDDAGLVLPEKNEATWIAGLARLLDNPTERAELAARGLSRARSEFAWPEIARRHLAFFDELLDRRTP